MPSELYKKQTMAQIAYMNCLARLGAPQNYDDLQNIPIDPQGRILVDVTLKEEQIAQLMRTINELTKRQFSLNKKGLDKALGRTVSATTTVSMDLLHNTHLQKKFDRTLYDHLNKIAGASNAKEIIAELNSHPKSSIIALQQEFHFHLSLVARVYQKKVPDLKDKSVEIQKALQLAHKELNTKILEAYARALKNSTKDHVLDRAKLNKELDKARQTLMPAAHAILMRHIVKQTGVIVKKDDFEKRPTGLTLKNIAEQTTATPNDILHMDSEQGLVTLIAGSENTAHHRTKGKQFAHRQLITHALKSGTIRPNLNTRIQIRTPSPVVKVGLLNNNEYINDVRKKLNAITKEYDLQNRLINEKKPRAFIYNSYTAINDTLGDTGGNLQTQSAHHILRGAHRYNTQQLLEHPEQPVLCFVQNISVNGFGSTLGYNQNDTLVTESTLMTEIALLHTLYETVPASQASALDVVFNKYKHYLERSPSRELFFSQSAEGKKTIQLIQSIKKDWQTANEPTASQDVMQQAKLALRHLMAHDAHLPHDYAKLFQTLSVFVEDASIGGCKSGNERAQCINGRVAILDSLLNSDDSTDKKEIRRALAVLAQGGEHVPRAAQALKTALDKEYNRAGLHGAASVVSLVDQGASAKVESKPGHPFYISRNFGEEQAAVISYLHQTKAGSMQAHKDLTTHMKNAWDGTPKSWWARMQSSPLGLFGAIAGVITILPALGVALYSAYDNGQRKAVTQHSNFEMIKDNVGVPLNEDPYESSHKKILETLSDIPATPVFPVTALINSMQSTRPASSANPPPVQPTDPSPAVDDTKSNSKKL